MSPDLQLARVFYTMMRRRRGARQPPRWSAPRRSARRGQLAAPAAPEIEFRFDESVAHQDRIEQILRDLHEEEAQRAEPDAAARSGGTAPGAAQRAAAAPATNEATEDSDGHDHHNR